VVCSWCMCSDPYAKFPRWPTSRPIRQRVDHLANRSTYWAMGKFGVLVNSLPKQLTGAPRECTSQPTDQEVNQLTVTKPHQTITPLRFTNVHLLIPSDSGT
jgi:hypothetical protein